MRASCFGRVGLLSGHWWIQSDNEHAENPHTFQSLQLNLQGERDAEREKMTGDVEASKDTKSLHGRVTIVILLCSLGTASLGIDKQQVSLSSKPGPNSVAALYAWRKHLTKLMCSRNMSMFTCRNKARTRSSSEENRIPAHWGLLRDQDRGTQEQNNDGWGWLDILCELKWVWLCSLSLRAADRITKPGLWR